MMDAKPRSLDVAERGENTRQAGPAPVGGDGGIYKAVLPASTFSVLRQLTKESQFLVFVTLATSILVCLRRYQWLDKTVRFFTPALVQHARAHLDGTPVRFAFDFLGDFSFQDLLVTVRERLLEGYRAHRASSVDSPVSEPDGDSDWPPRKVIISLRGVHMKASTHGCPIAITGDFRNDQFEVSASFDGSAGGEEAVKRLLRHACTVLEDGVRDTRKKISSLAMETRADTELTVRRWNETLSPLSEDRRLTDHFKAVSTVCPNNVCVDYEGRLVTYGEMDAATDRRAVRLREWGVREGVIVALGLKDPLEMVKSILAVHKAGGAYMPLNPDHPAGRIRRVLTECERPMVLLDDGDVFHRVGGLGRCVFLSELKEETADSDLQFPVYCNAGGRALAYVIFTSGSTATPKGVEIEHKGLLNLAAAQTETFGITPESRVLQFAPFDFDASVAELASTFYAGATLVIASRDDLLPGPELAGTLKRLNVTHVTLPPSVLSALPNDDIPSLRTIVSAGERCWPELVARWGRGRSFFNAYGPTEVTVCATIATCNTRDIGKRAVPIGRPIANTEVYILDDEQRLQPIGVPGEICVGGIGIGRGYLNQPDATHARFVSVAGLPQSCASPVYRTGDFGRYMADGQIEFLGRLDEETKIRGVRVHPLEVENVLLQNPEVKSAAVTTYVDPVRGTSLAAFFTGEITPSALRAHLAAFLPLPLVPSLVIPVDAMPTMPSGKVDKRALIDVMGSSARSAYLAPRNTKELSLVHIWEDIFEQKHIGVRDNFFDLGGNSLLAVRLARRMHAVFGENVPITRVFESPTIADLAMCVEPSTQVRNPIVAIQRRGTKKPVFCAHPAVGTVFCYTDLAYLLEDDRPFLAFQAVRLEVQDGPKHSLADLADAYLAAMRESGVESPYILLGWSMGGQIAYEMACRCVRHGGRVLYLGIIDAAAQLPSALRIREDIDLLADLLGEDARLRVDLARRAFRDNGRLEMILDVAREVDAVSADFGAGQAKQMLATFSALLTAGRDYQPGLYPGMIHYYAADEASSDTSDGGSAWGWGELAEQGVVTRRVPGSHLTMIRRPNVQVLADSIRRDIAAAEASMLLRDG